jgi:hypothetical protein
MLALAHEPVEQGGEFTEPFHTLNAGDLRGFFLRQLVPFPNRDEVAGFAQEEYLAHVFLVGIGIKQKNALLLINASKIKQIGVLAENKRAIGVGWQNVVCIYYGERVGKQELLEILSVLSKKPGLDRLIAHGNEVPPGTSVIHNQIAAFPQA